MGNQLFSAQYKQSLECLNMLEGMRVVTNVNTRQNYVGPDVLSPP